jgi:molybdopterin-guanine dinucleotide biosynthesis protein A
VDVPGRPLTGIVLAGGSSTRFGVDKASALFRGETMLQLVCRALEVACDRIVVVLAPGQLSPRFSVAIPAETVTDDVAGRGPLEGIRRGLQATATDLAAVVATDAPLLQPRLLTYLASLAAGHHAVVPQVGGILQPLVAVYRVAPMLAAVDDALAAGRRSVVAAIEGLDILLVQEPELRSVDPELHSFRNANTPQELAALERLVRS